MKLSFYPGCSLEGMANDYARSITAVFKHLGIELVEIEDWSCCGATAAHSLDEMLTVALPARNIAAAEKLGLDMVSPCANCFNQPAAIFTADDQEKNIRCALEGHRGTSDPRYDAISGGAGHDRINPAAGQKAFKRYECRLLLRLPDGPSAENHRLYGL